jgi:hypothetical protein
MRMNNDGAGSKYFNPDSNPFNDALHTNFTVAHDKKKHDISTACPSDRRSLMTPIKSSCTTSEKSCWSSHDSPITLDSALQDSVSFLNDSFTSNSSGHTVRWFPNLSTTLEQTTSSQDCIASNLNIDVITSSERFQSDINATRSCSISHLEKNSDDENLDKLTSSERFKPETNATRASINFSSLSPLRKPVRKQSLEKRSCFMVETGTTSSQLPMRQPVRQRSNNKFTTSWDESFRRAQQTDEKHSRPLI